MSRLPEKGEITAAAAAMNARMEASATTVVGETFDVGYAEIDRVTGDMRTEALGIYGVYGDLFDVGEMVAQSAGVVEMFLADIAAERRDVLSAMISMYLMAAGLGALVERKRWETRS